MAKIGIFCYHELNNAYSCLLYLQETLEKYADVELWGITPQKEMNQRHNYHSFLDTWYGKLPKVRFLFAKLHFMISAYKYNIIIINDLSFFVEGIFIKRLFKNKILIHYNTELCNREDYFTFSYLLKFYAKHADRPDMIIDCLRERAEYRKTQYGITKPVYSINNTLPREKKIVDTNFDVKKYITFDEELPIAIYAGGANVNRGMEFILSDVAKLGGKINFLLFLYGNDNSIEKIKGIAGNVKNCRIYKSVERSVLLNVMSHCDIGIQYYDPTAGTNQYYASPSKFYEYVAMGLNIISSNNEGINHVIEENDLGICIQSGESFGDAIQRLLDKGLKSKQYIQQIFEQKLCYEIDSQNAIKKICEFIDMIDNEQQNEP